MRMKQNALLIMLVILLSSVFWLGIVTSSPGTEVRAPTIIDPTLGPGDTFNVSVTIFNVTNLYGWEVKLSFDPAILNATAVSQPDPNFLGPNTTWTFWLQLPVIDNVLGFVRMGDTFYPPPYPPEGVSGNGTLAIITFKVVSRGITSLHFESSELFTIVPPDIKYDIPHTAVDGYFDNLRYPVAFFTYSPESPLVDETVTFNASASTPNGGTITNYLWDFGDGTNETGVIVAHNYTVEGNYVVNLTITDSEGVSDSHTKELIVMVPIPPVAFFTYSPESPLVDETVTFNASASTPNGGTITNYLWDFGDGTNETGVIVAHNYTVEGNYVVNLTITDSEGVSDSHTKELIVKVAEPPVAVFTYSPETPVVGETVTFNASESYDPDGDIISYGWDFGDGTVVNLTNPVATHVYNSTGTYTVGLNVTDNNDLTDAATLTVVVGKQSSTINISASPTTIKVDENTTISGSITPTRQGVTVTIRYRTNGGEWSTLTMATTDSNGQYSYVWTPETVGTYEVKASWNGDENTLPDESILQTIEVEEVPSPSQGIPPSIIIVAAVAIVITIAVIAVYFLKTRKAT